MYQLKQKKQGFTLAEVVIVIVIISVIATLAIPSFLATVERSRALEARNILLALFGSQKRYELENDVYTAVIGDLDVTIPYSTYFTDPSVAAASPLAKRSCSIAVGNYGQIKWSL